MQIKAWIISSKKKSILYPVIIFWNIMFHISQFILLEAIKWFDAFDKKPKLETLFLGKGNVSI